MEGIGTRIQFYRKNKCALKDYPDSSHQLRLLGHNSGLKRDCGTCREESKERRKSWPMVSFTMGHSKSRKGFGLQSGLRLKTAGRYLVAGYTTGSEKVSFVAATCNSEPRLLMSHLPCLQWTWEQDQGQA